MKTKNTATLLGIAILFFALGIGLGFWLDVLPVEKYQVLFEQRELILKQQVDDCRTDLVGYAGDLAVCNYTKERIEKHN